MTFEPSLWENSSEISLNEDLNYKQLAFPGTHTAVGGGGPVRGIQDCTLDWMLRGAREAKLDFDTDDTSPIFDLQPDHRAQLHNQSQKSGWGAKDWVVGFGLRDRKLGGLRIQDVAEMTIRRVQEAADRLPEQHKYEPPSLGHLLNAMRKADTKDKVEVDEALVGSNPYGRSPASRPRQGDRISVHPGTRYRRSPKKHLAMVISIRLILLHNQNAGCSIGRGALRGKSDRASVTGSLEASRTGVLATASTSCGRNARPWRGYGVVALKPHGESADS